MSMFDKPEFAADLRKVAHDANLRNRVVPADTRPRCKCGNLLTIADRYSRCGQCALEARLVA
jgi:hypothetical protein